MELQEAINKRRSIRQFQSKKIEEEKIRKIIDAGRLAPSAKNRQPWKFYLATAEVKDSIVALMKEWHEHNPNKKTSVLGTAYAMDTAPMVILVFKDSTGGFTRSDTLSIGGAIQTMLLTATELGLGSLWIADTTYVKKEISQLIETDLTLYSCIALGYANENPKPRSRKTVDEILLDKEIKTS